MDAQATDSEEPGPGEAYYYVARGDNCVPQGGTFDTAGPGQAGSRDAALQGPGAVCPCPAEQDPDGDGYCGAVDNCPGVPNDQADADADGHGDVCDNCPYDHNPGQVDLDGDGRGQPCDNCLWVANPGQADSNDNGVGDACECWGPDDCDDGDPCTEDTCVMEVQQDPPTIPGQCRFLGNCP
jgi:hypothetical protein